MPAAVRPSPPAAHPPPPADLLTWPAPWVCALIGFLTVIVYLPAMTGGLLWDDAGHVTRPELRSLAGLGRIWFEVGATQQYYPLLHSAFWLEHRLWGDATLGYHLVNALLHGTAACLFGGLLRRLAVPGAWLAALLFALHPVCVESVAWITEQKNTLSAVFYLAAALAYLEFDRGRRGAPYALATGLFLAALLTKSVTATLPAALLVVCWWQRGRLSWSRDVGPLLPWFAASAGAGWLTAWIERTQIGAQGADFALSAAQRLLIAGRALWFYLGSLVWPGNLVFIYPRWEVDATALWQWLFPATALAALGALLWWRRRQRGLLAAALLSAGTLFPALGFIDVYPFVYSFVADHFQYHACLAVFAAAAAGWAAWTPRLPRGLGRILAFAVLAALGAVTWAQSGMYRDVFTLYRATLARNPNCWMAHNNLGIALSDAGRVDEAVAHLEAALKLKPGDAQTSNNLGWNLTLTGRQAEAVPHLERALQVRPGYAEAHNNLGVALLGLGRTNEGDAQLEQALKLKPAYPEAHLNLGLALAKSGRPAEAVAHFERAVRLRPGYAEAELNWAIGLTLTDRFAEAVPHFERALQLKPDNVQAHGTYGRALARAGRLDDAITAYQRALSLAPDSADTHLGLALVLRQAGRTDEAARHFEEARRLGRPGEPGLR